MCKFMFKRGSFGASKAGHASAVSVFLVLGSALCLLIIRQLLTDRIASQTLRQVSTRPHSCFFEKGGASQTSLPSLQPFRRDPFLAFAGPVACEPLKAP